MQKIDSALSNRLAKMSFICSLMVVVLHANVAQGGIGKFVSITCLAVPIFFMMSGYLFAGRMYEPGWYWRQVRSRARSLMLPYVLWNFLYLAFVIGVLMSAEALIHPTGIREFLQSAANRIGSFGFDPFCFPPLGVMWFVRCLIVFTILSPIFMLWSKRYGWCLSLLGYVAYFLYSYYFPEQKGDWPTKWMAKSWVRATFWFGLGVWLRFNVQVNCRVSRGLGMGLLSVGWILLGLHGLAFYALGIPIGVVGLWLYISGRPWPAWLTGLSFPIFVLHPFFQRCVGLRAASLWGGCGLEVLSVLRCLVMIGGAVAVGAMLRKFLPRFSKFAFGGR